MMGKHTTPQDKLFYTNFNLDSRIPQNHPLRNIQRHVDFEFVYEEVSATYGSKGNVSVPPPIILKLMLLLVLYNVRSERELLETLPVRLDWLWFLGYDIDTEVPDHSVLSKARKRWGQELFRNFFERIVWQCVEAGLVDGSKIFVDSSLIDADASNNSIVDTQSLRHQVSAKYKKLEARLEEQEEDYGAHNDVNRRFVSATDPDAAIVRRGTSKLSYQTHRVVDGENEVITATVITAGDVNEAHMMTPLLDRHRDTTGISAGTVVADSKYGTIENYLACHDRGVAAHMPDLGATATDRSKKNGIFTEADFVYDREKDMFICPAGEILKAATFHSVRQSVEYRISKKICNACPLKVHCTKSKTGRTLKRHAREEELRRMREASRTKQAKENIKTRQHLMERSFARSKRYGYDRARWRGLWKVGIQEYLICAVQNIQVLMRHMDKPSKAAAKTVNLIRTAVVSSIALAIELQNRIPGSILRIFFPKFNHANTFIGEVHA